MKSRFCASIALMCLAATGYGQSTAIKESSDYLTVPFDLDQTNVGTSFKGHDITAVVKAIKDSPARKEKSEFETTAAFQARRFTFADQPLFEGVSPAASLAFVLKRGHAFRYDADKGSMNVSLEAMNVSLEANPRTKLDSISVQSDNLDADSYVGQNAYGATVTVKSLRVEVFKIAFEQPNWLFERKLLTSEFNRSFALDAAKAEAIKPDLKLVMIGRLTEPWFDTEDKFHSATIRFPIELSSKNNYLRCSPVELWVINSRTGEVLHKFSESSAAAPTAKDSHSWPGSSRR